MRSAVLDSDAVLALFFDEPSAEQVENILHAAAEADKPALIDAVNWAEVLCMMRRIRGEEGVAAAKRFAETLPVQVVPVDGELTEVVAKLKSVHELPLSCSFAAALAIQKKAELVTGNISFKSVEGELKRIVWLK